LIPPRFFDHDKEPSVTDWYDCGAASDNFALQGFHQGLVVHGRLQLEDARKVSESVVEGPFRPKKTLI
jgi:hypothetical protein